MIELKNGEMVLGVLPERGAALGYWRHAGHDILYPVADPNLIAQQMQPVAGYPLVPFSNRIKNGAFEFEGETYQLDKNFRSEPHAIHGNGWERAWTINQLLDDRVVLGLVHEPIGAFSGQWPFSYRAVLSYTLEASALVVSLSIENTDHRNQPVGLGFHPFFARRGGVSLQFFAENLWSSGPDNLPAERLVNDGRWSFNALRPVEGDVIDNCYNGSDGHARIVWPQEAQSLHLVAGPDVTHMVLYTPQKQPYFACEAVTNMNDAFNRREIPDNGTHVLHSGKSFGIDIRYEFEKS